MAEEDTNSLELVPIEVWNSREALDTNVEDLEEGALRAPVQSAHRARCPLFKHPPCVLAIPDYSLMQKAESPVPKKTQTAMAVRLALARQIILPATGSASATSSL